MNIPKPLTPRLRPKAPSTQASASHHDEDFTYTVTVRKSNTAWHAWIYDGLGEMIREGRHPTKEAMLKDVERTFSILLFL